MQTYRYIKVAPVTITVPLVPFFSFVLGAALLIWVIAPILSFNLFFTSTDFITPLAKDVYATDVENKTDFSKASSWFPKNPTKRTDSLVDTYEISIPKLAISNATVKIGTDDLSKNLIHYGGTGIPGQLGNTVIFGHSVLPQFYNPSNYLTIFSLLPTLKTGDDVFVHFDGVDYRYEVIEARVTSPEDVSGLEQDFDDSYLTLVTCVPPGTYFQRLWTKLKVKPYGDL